MNEQLLKDFIATAQKYNYNWNTVFGKFPELKGYDQQLLKDYVATAEKNNYDYDVVNSKFPELGFKQEPVKKKESTDLGSKSEKPTLDYSTKEVKQPIKPKPVTKKVGGAEIIKGYPSDPNKEYKFENGVWYETKYTPSAQKPTRDISASGAVIQKGGTPNLNIQSEYVQIKSPSRVAELNRYFKKQGSTSTEFQTFTGLPGNENREYRVSDGNWIRKDKGTDNWVTITDEKNIAYLNSQFKQDVKPFKSKAEVDKAKDYNNLEKQFQNNLSYINSKLVDQSEESVVPKLQQLFPAFKFEQSQAGADRVMVTAPNGKQEEFLLDNYTFSQDKQQADMLRGWLNTNYDPKVAKEEAELRRVEKMAEDKVETKVLPGGGSVTTVTPSFMDRDVAFPIIENQAKKERADYYRAKSEQVKEVFNKYSDYVNKTGKVDDTEARAALAELKADDAEIKRLNAYQDDIKLDIQDYATKKKDAAAFLNNADAKLRSGEITQAQYDLQYKPQIEKMEADLKVQQSRIKAQTDNSDLVKKSAERAAAENFLIQESKGSFGGGLAYSSVKALTSLPRLALGIMGIDGKDLAENTAKELGLYTTKEYMESEKRADLAKAAFSLTESLVAMGTGGSAAGSLALYGMGYYEMKDELDQVEGMTEQQKMIMAGAYGLVSAALERFGLEAAVGKIDSATGKSLKMGIMKQVFSSLPKDAPKEVIEAAIMNETKKYLTSAGLDVAGGMIAEGTTEALQSLSAAGMKELYDVAKETNYFNKEGAGKVFEDALYEGYLGALGGGIMSTVYNAGQAGVRGMKANSNELKLLMQAAETEGMDSAVLASVKADMLSGKINKEQAQAIVQNFQEVKSKVDQMPDGITTEGKSVALSLMTERDELNNQIAGKDPNLVKPQTDRINEINNSLQQIPIDYAVQEQGAGEVPVQSGAGVSTEVEEGVSETKPEGVTGEVVGEEVKVEGTQAEQPQAEVAQEIVQSEENQRLIDDYVKIETGFINGLTVINQKEKQQRIQELETDPIAFAEKNVSITEIGEYTPHTDFLNSLQRQPATQEVVLSESQKQAYEKLSDEDKKVVDELINDESYEKSIGAQEITGEISLEDEINQSAISFEDSLNKALNISQPKETISEDTEVFTFGDSKYDINKANDIISKESLQPVDVSVDVLPKMSYSFISVDENTVKNADITKPVIIAKTKDGLLLIDGHHRVRKAIQENQPIKAFVLNENQTSEVTGQPVVQETVQAEVQAQPTAKIETIEVQEVPQVEQSLNDLTQQNNVLTENDFTAARIQNVGKEKVVAQVARAAKAIAKVLPKVKIVVHATPEAFVEATKDMDGRLSEGGLYDRKTGQIHINLEKATNRTVAHEVFHALILSRVNTDLDAQRLTRSMIGAVRKSLKKAEGTTELMSYLEDFESNYDENIKNEEKLAELFAVLADNYKQLPPASKNVIIRFLNRLAKALGLKEMTDREAIEFMNTLSRKVEIGQEIEAREVGQQREGEAAVRKQKGLINLTDQEAVKYARAGVENKYDAQAIKQIGLQGTKFDKQSIIERIQKEFDGLVKNTTDYIFREDSPAIDQAIQNEIDTMVDQGFSNAQIENAKRAFSPGRERDNVINEYRRAQVETANQWESYLGQSDYPASFKYLILDAVLTNNYDLKTDRYQKRTGKTIRNFTPFDAGTLAELYMSDSNELLKDYVRIQADNSANIVESAAFSSTKDGKWIKFDGGDGVSQQELQDNANKLSQLVQNTYWCTKTNALSQLRDGDFYVYVTENKQGDFDSRIAVRMDGDKVGEVRGNASSKQDLEADMLPVADTFLREKIPNDSGKKWLDSIAYNTKVKDLTEKIDTKVLNMDDVYEYIDIIKDKDKFSVDYGENGLVQTLQDKFRNAKFSFGVAESQTDIKDDTLLLLAPNDIYTYMFYKNEQTKNVQVIIGNVNIYDDFDGGKVKAITGNVEFEDSSVKKIKSIESIGGGIRFRNSEIKDLGSIESIGGDVSFRNSEVRYLGNLESIGGRAVFRDSEVRSLENLKYIGGRADFYDSFVEDLGSLKEIGGDADFENSEIINLDGLKKIGGNANFNYSDVESLGALELIGGHAEFENSKIDSLGRLKEIGGNAYFQDSNVKDLGDLESIRFGVWFNNKIKDLGKLKPVARGKASFGLNTELEKQYKERQERQFAVRKQKTTGPSRIVENGVKAGKTDAQIRQEGKAAGFTNKEMTEALSKYYTKEQGIFMKSGIKGKVGQFVDFAKRWKQKYLTTKGLLAKVGFTYKEKMEGEISAEANRAAKTAKKFGVLFDKFTGDKELLKDAFDKVLRGNKSIQLPAGFAGLANEMRNHIDRLSQMLIDSGAVDADMADTIRKNIGAYITRSYEIFDNKNFRQKIGEQELQAAKNFLRTQPGMIALAQAEAARTGVTVDEALDALVDNKIEEYFADAETGALIKGSKLGSKDLSTLKERKEIPEQIRMLMGEYSDPAMNYARTVLNIATLAARHQFLTQVKEAGMGKFFFEKNDSQRPKGFDTEIAAEGSDTMSPLNGLMTTPEIAEAFGLYNGQKGEENWAQQLKKTYYKAMGLVKWLKTIGSVGTHAKNIFSNFTFVGVNGHSIAEIGKAIKVVAQDLKTMSKPDVEAKIDEYIKAGIMRQGAGINEIRDMFKDADMDGFLERRLSMRKPNKGVVGKIKQVISSRASKIISAMEDAYQAEDDMFKIAAYETEMNRYADALYNKSKDQLTDKERQEVSDIAANNVKNTYPTYSRIPEGIKQLRKFPLFIGSFISFQAESYRTAYNTIALAKNELSSDNEKIRKIGAKRVAGASAYLTAKTAILSYLGYAAGTGFGGVLGALFDDDDEEKKQKDVRSFLPPWSKNSDLIILKAADGEIEYIDFSASDAYGGINKALNAFFNGEDMLDSFKQSTLELVGQFQGPDILTNLAIQLTQNENDFGKPIYNEEDTLPNKIDKVLEYVYKVIEPGTFTSIRKGANSEQSLGQIAFGDLTGLKVRKSNVKDQFGYKLSEFDDSFSNIRKKYNSEYYKTLRMIEDPKISNKEVDLQKDITDEAFINANKDYAKKAKELMDLINSANRLGVDYDELIDQLETIKGNMGKSNIYEMEDEGEEFINEKEY